MDANHFTNLCASDIIRSLKNTYCMKRPLAFICIFFSIILALSARFPEDYETKYSSYDNKTVTLTGTVSDIAYKPKDGYEQEIIYLKEGVICYIDSSDETIPPIGSLIRVSGRGFLFDRATNDGQFDAYKYYATIKMHVGINNAHIEWISNEYSELRNALFKLRRAMSQALERTLPSKEASVMKTMLLGEKSQIDAELKELYRRNGIAHVLAISGLHISLLGMGILKVLRYVFNLKPKISAVMASGLVIGYGAMTGFSPSSVRAIFMFCIAMLATLCGRTYDMTTAVSVAFLILLIDNPLYIHNSGFAFSFGCVSGIAMLTPALVASKNNKPLKGYKNSILSSLSITVASLPVYLWHYYQIPIYAIFLNFLIIPVMAILVPAGIILIASERLCPILLPWVRYLVVGILRLFTILSEKTDVLPGHYFTPGKPSTIQVLFYIGILVYIILRRKRLALAAKWGIVCLAICVLIIRFRPPLEISFLDVGQGDSIFLRSNEISLLVDGGSTSVKEVGKHRIIPFLKERGAASIDMVVVTHPDEDHMNGILELLTECKKEGIKIKKLGLPDVEAAMKEEGTIALKEAASRCGCQVVALKAGDGISGNQIKIDVLSPRKMTRVSDMNEASVVLRVNYRGFKTLLTGDLEGIAEDYAANKAGDIDLLKVAHHGSKNSTSDSFLDSVKPEIAVISVGKNSRYGHPHKETLDRLSRYTPDIRVLRTDECGQVSVKLKKGEVEIRKFIDIRD